MNRIGLTPHRSGLFGDKHYVNMGNAIWLFGLLISMVTKEQNREGLVFNGKPVAYVDIHKRNPTMKQRTYVRDLRALRDGNYISTKQAQNGLIITTKNSKKFLTNRYDKSVVPDTTKSVPRYDKSVLSDTTKSVVPLEDTKEDTKGIGRSAPTFSDFEEIWGVLFPIFCLPESSMKSYLDQISETIERLGIVNFKKA